MWYPFCPCHSASVPSNRKRWLELNRKTLSWCFMRKAGTDFSPSIPLMLNHLTSCSEMNRLNVSDRSKFRQWIFVCVSEWKMISVFYLHCFYEQTNFVRWACPINKHHIFQLYETLWASLNRLQSYPLIFRLLSY